MKGFLAALAVAFLATSAPIVEAGIIKKAAKAAVVATVIKKIIVSKKRFPESAKHIEDAQKAGAPKTLTVDRAGAAERRRAALKGKDREVGKDRDEYPPAMTMEGGKGASVRNVDRPDNRGAGACVGAQCRDVPDGGKIRIDVAE